MGKKILMLTMSCNNSHYKALLGAVRDTWARPLVKNMNKDIVWFSYTSCDEEHPKPCVDFNEHMIYVDVEDDRQHTYTKTKKAYEMIKDMFDFDFVVRTNTSVFVNIENMSKLINSVNDNTVIGRTFGYYICNQFIELSFNFTIGFFFGMSKKLFDIAMSYEDDGLIDRFGKKLYGYCDDVIMSVHLTNTLGNLIEYKSIESTGDNTVYVYKPYEGEIEDEHMSNKHRNDIIINNPDEVNRHVIVKLRSFYPEYDLRRTYELIHYYELDEHLEK